MEKGLEITLDRSSGLSKAGMPVDSLVRHLETEAALSQAMHGEPDVAVDYYNLGCLLLSSENAAAKQKLATAGVWNLPVSRQHQK